jgi:hypothetical protein
MGYPNPHIGFLLLIYKVCFLLKKRLILNMKNQLTPSSLAKEVV